ncbi:MAG: response regulator transcription factor [Ignavibacteriales bacterium]|nr:response regulator transcription factor [Ignavibacteriales bacterium]
MKKNSIVFADDHVQFLQGIIPIITKRDDIEIMEQAHDGMEAINIIRLIKPDIAVLDIQMPKINGFNVAQMIIREKLPTKIIFLTMYDDASLVKKGFELGIKGYVLKENAFSEIDNCLETVIAGGYYVSPQLASALFNITLPKIDVT